MKTKKYIRNFAISLSSVILLGSGLLGGILPDTFQIPKAAASSFSQSNGGLVFEKDILLTGPINTSEDLPGQVTFSIYHSATGDDILYTQTYARGQYEAEYEITKSDGVFADPAVKIKAELFDIDPADIDTYGEIWLEVSVDSVPYGERTILSKSEILQKLNMLAVDNTLSDPDLVATMETELGASPVSGLAAIQADVYPSAIGTDAYGFHSSAPIDSMFISSTGDVGIGTTTPTKKMEVAGTVYATNPIPFQYKLPVSGLVDNLLYVNGADEVFFGRNGTKLHFRAGSTVPRMTITDAGNVGLGTTNPTEKLEVAGTVYSTAQIPFQYKLPLSGLVDNLLYVNAADEVFFGRNGTKLHFRAGSTEARMTVTDTGNVGIGTTNPTYALSVNGTIRSKELIVDTDWADYVFEDDYNLLSLNDVEKYIKSNRRLPDVPSAQEVVNNGVSVGEAQTKLLQKVEELTLYLIDLNKEITTLKSEMAAIKLNNNNN